MFTSIIKELLGTKIAEIYIEILPTLIDDEYENSKIASQKEIGSITKLGICRIPYAQCFVWLHEYI